MGADAANLFWIDLEMTGLDAHRCFIMQVATLVTNDQLEVVAEGPDLIVHNTEEELATLSDWCRDTFGGSGGLIERVRASTLTLAEAEQQTLDFLHQHVLPGHSPLCGNSVHNDRRFMERLMPRLHDFAHYRNIDVSTVKECVRRWYPANFSPPPKSEAHDAMTDIRQSIDELRYYRERFFIASS